MTYQVKRFEVALDIEIEDVLGGFAIVGGKNNAQKTFDDEGITVHLKKKAVVFL